MTERLSIGACRSLEDEVRAAVRAAGLDDVEVVPLPLVCGQVAGEWGPLAQRLEEAGHGASWVCVGCASCLPAAATSVSLRDGCRVEQAEQCFDRLVNHALVEQLQSEGAYLVTAGWLQRRREIFAAWGFPEGMAGKFLAESARSIVLLDTGVDSDAEEHLAAFAAETGLPARRLAIGLDMLCLWIERVAGEWRAGRQRREASLALLAANRKAADYAAVLDMVESLSAAPNEYQALTQIAQIFGMLLPAHAISIVSLHHGEPGVFVACPEGHLALDGTLARGRALMGEYTLDEDHEGFTLRLAHRGRTVGYLVVDDLSMPEYAERYLNLALSIGTLCGVAIANARAMAGVIVICANCKRVRDTDREWRALESFVRHHTSADFSHGVCPDCAALLYPDIPLPQ